jgi:hypothetical protein
MEVARLPRSSSRCREPFRIGSQYCSPRASLMILGAPANPGNCQRCWALIGFDGSRRVIAVAETSWTGGVERPGTEHVVEQNTRLSPPSYQYGAIPFVSRHSLRHLDGLAVAGQAMGRIALVAAAGEPFAAKPFACPIIRFCSQATGSPGWPNWGLPHGLSDADGGGMDQNQTTPAPSTQCKPWSVATSSLQPVGRIAADRTGLASSVSQSITCPVASAVANHSPSADAAR